MCVMPRQTWMIAIATVLCGMLSVSVGFNLAVMSIDLGSEYTKIAIVKPGVPMEIVLNDESSRKTSTMVAMRDGERHYGGAAMNTAVKFPPKAFWYLTHIVGLRYEDPQVELYRKRFPYYNLVKDEDRGTVLFKIDEETSYSPEELLAMVLEKARSNAEAFADQPIKDAVITVPVYFTQSQRKSVLQAAAMVDLNILQIMSDTAAVALNYGVFRRKMFNSTVQHYMFYDMGATSTTAAVVGYQMVKTKEGTRVETNPQLVIKGVGFDKNLGGLEMTLRLRDHLAKAFNSQKKTKTDVYTNNRAMGKLFKEAERVKKVLSANTDHLAQVEGLLEDIDFKLKVTRAELEEMSKDLFARVTKPIQEALKVSHVTMPEITEVILFGGGTRVPRVQEVMLKYLGRKELGKSINTDEAAALGGVYQAAHLGKGFKVKTFAVKEANIYPITVEFERVKADDSGSEEVRTIKRTLFGRMNPFPQRKVMTFSKHFKDFAFNVTYGDLSFLSKEDAKSFESPLMSTFNLEGVETAHKKHSESTESKGIKAHFRMDENGILLMDKVESVFEKQEEKVEESTWSKIGSTLGGLFGSKEEPKDTAAKSEDTEPPTEGDKSDSTTDSTPDSQGEGQTEETGSDQPKPDESGSEKSKQDKTDSDKEDKKTSDEKVPAEEEEKKDSTKKEDEKKDEEKEKKTDDKKKEETEDKANKTKEAEEAKSVNKTIVVRENITTEVKVHDIPDLTKGKFKASKKRLADLTAKDKEKKLLEKAKNDLEAYIFDMGDKLTQSLYEKCSTEEERENISKQLSEASDWMYEQDDETTRQVYTDKLKALQKLSKDIEFRVKETKERPEALAALKSMLNHSDFFLKTVKNLSKAEDPIFTEVEVTTLEKLINDTYEWKRSMVKEQDKVALTEKPKMLLEDIALKIQALDREVKYLINKAKYFKPKPKPSKTKSENETVAGSDKTSANETKDQSESTNQDDENGKVEVEGEEPIGEETENKNIDEPSIAGSKDSTASETSDTGPPNIGTSTDSDETDATNSDDPDQEISQSSSSTSDNKPDETNSDTHSTETSQSPDYLTTETSQSPDSLAAETSQSPDSLAAETSQSPNSLAAETSQSPDSLATETSQSPNSLAAETSQSADSLATETSQSADSLAAETSQSADSLATETSQSPDSLATETSQSANSLATETSQSANSLATETSQSPDSLATETSQSPDSLATETSQSADASTASTSSDKKLDKTNPNTLTTKTGQLKEPTASPSLDSVDNKNDLSSTDDTDTAAHSLNVTQGSSSSDTETTNTEITDSDVTLKSDVRCDGESDSCNNGHDNSAQRDDTESTSTSTTTAGTTTTEETTTERTTTTKDKTTEGTSEKDNTETTHDPSDL